MGCPFCDISKERFRTIREGHSVYVLLSNPRLVKGHLLVIPKRHVLRLSELDAEERKELFDALIEFQERILARLAPGCDIRQHFRPFIKQGRLKVDHIHMHLIPRELGDELHTKAQIYETPLFIDMGEDERKEILEMLKD